MAATVAGFLLCHPEFANAGTALLTAQLAQIELVVSDSFGAQRDQVVYLSLADRLATSPSGRDARMLAGPEGSATSVYATELERLKRANAVRALRLGVAD